MSRRSARKGHERKRAAAADQLRQGMLSLREVLGLTPAEVEALGRVADGMRRRGSYAEAQSIYGALVAIEPLDAEHWGALAALQLSQGEHGLAVMCFEALALLEGRRPERTRLEAASLRQLGAPQLARELERHAACHAAVQPASDRPGGRP